MASVIAKCVSDLKLISHILMRHCWWSPLIFLRNDIDTFMDVWGLWPNIYSERGGSSTLNFNVTSICLGHCHFDAFSPAVGFECGWMLCDFHPASSEYTALKDVPKWGEEKEWKFVCDDGSPVSSWEREQFPSSKMFYGANMEMPALTSLIEVCSEMRSGQLKF